MKYGNERVQVNERKKSGLVRDVESDSGDEKHEEDPWKDKNRFSATETCLRRDSGAKMDEASEEKSSLGMECRSMSLRVL